MLNLLLTFCFNLGSLGLKSSEEIVDISMQFLLFTDELAKASDNCLRFPPIFKTEHHHFSNFLCFHLQ
jgi:hypothetical protein